MIKKIFITTVIILSGGAMWAQVYNTPEKDSVIGSTHIFDQLSQAQGGHIVIKQNQQIQNLVTSHNLRNTYKKISGFRVRIFFDSGQNARQRSEEIASIFISNNPNIPVYRVYEDLYYKVAVGDFRTKSDATRYLRIIKRDYPLAFIIKENINYPSL